MNPNLREQVIAEYHTHLANDPSLTPDLFARLKSGDGGISHAVWTA